MSKIINGITCRTREESLKHILDQARKSKIGPSAADGKSNNCQYVYPSGNHCAVGCLLDDKQLKDIERRELNEMSIWKVGQTIGEINLTTVTGMTFLELKKLQNLHDTKLGQKGPAQARKAIMDYCKEELKNLQANV